MDLENGEPSPRPSAGRGGSNTGATVPDEDFFSLIMRVQGGRMDDQRAAVSSFISLSHLLFLINISFKVPFPAPNRARNANPPKK